MRSGKQNAAVEMRWAELLDENMPQELHRHIEEQKTACSEIVASKVPRTRIHSACVLWCDVVSDPCGTGGGTAKSLKTYARVPAYLWSDAMKKNVRTARRQLTNLVEVSE